MAECRDGGVCTSCGELVSAEDAEVGYHPVPGHHPGCDGGGEACRRLCPVQEQCGPVGLCPGDGPREASDGEEVESLIGCQRLGVACGLDFDEEDATLHLRRDDGNPEPLEGGRTKRALCGTVVGWDTPGGSLFSAPRCARCFAVADAEGFTELAGRPERESGRGEGG